MNTMKIQKDITLKLPRSEGAQKVTGCSRNQKVYHLLIVSKTTTWVRDRDWDTGLSSIYSMDKQHRNYTQYPLTNPNGKEHENINR